MRSQAHGIDKSFNNKNNIEKLDLVNNKNESNSSKIKVPVGIQIICDKFEEGKLFGIARGFEKL